jgi:hypothetical protein
MAHCKPDHKFIKAKRVVESLDDSEESHLIVYYIQQREKHIEKLSRKLKEHNDFFKKLNSLIR